MHGSWAAQGRAWKIEDSIRSAADCRTAPGIIDVDAEPLMLDSDMPERINHELDAASASNPSQTSPATSPCLRA